MEQLTLDFGIKKHCDCFYQSRIWSWEKRKWEVLDCLICGAENDRPRPEKILQDKILKLRKGRKSK